MQLDILLMTKIIFKLNLKLNQLHTVSRTHQGRQRGGGQEC